MTPLPLLVKCLLVLVGPPGAGKSEWAKRHGAGAVHVSQDDLIDAITPHGFRFDYRPVYAAAEDAVAREALTQGHTVIIDRTNRTRAHRERWVHLAQQHAAPIVAVEMSTPFAVCIERNRLRVGPRRVSDERMARMLAAMEPVQPDEGFDLICDDTAILARILHQVESIRQSNIHQQEQLHEYCHQAR